MQMTTSSSRPEGSAVYLVQSGIVAWEAPTAAPHQASRTVTICAPDIRVLSDLLSAMLAAGLVAGGRLFLWHVIHDPVWHNSVQKRRTLAGLRSDPPGFVGTLVEDEPSAVSVCSVWSGVAGRLDLDYLSSYRSTLMLITDVQLDVATLLKRIHPLARPFDSAALIAFREALPFFMLVRVLDLETYGALQFMGGDSSVALVTQWLDTHGIRRVDVREQVIEVMASRK